MTTYMMKLKQMRFAWGLGYASAVEIDEINIHQATLLAMQRAYLAMQIDALHVLCRWSSIVQRYPYHVQL